jgi:hypothetical protein
MSKLRKLATTLKGRWNLPAVLGILVILSCVVPARAYVILATTPEQILCCSQYVVVGTVLKATPKDCCCLAGKVIKDCDVVLEVKITEILGALSKITRFSPDLGIVIGKTVKLVTAVYDSAYFPATENEGHIGIVPGTTEPAIISELFEGKHFIFSIRLLRSSLWRESLPLKDQVYKQPYVTNVWRLENKDWIMKVLTKSSGMICPTLIAPGGDGLSR